MTISIDISGASISPGYIHAQLQEASLEDAVEWITVRLAERVTTMTQEQFDKLIIYINAKVALSQGKVPPDFVVECLERAEVACVGPRFPDQQD